MRRSILLFVPLLGACSGAMTRAPAATQKESARAEFLSRGRAGDPFASYVKDYDLQIATAAVAVDPGVAASPPPPPPPQAAPAAERKVIYTGSIALQVADPEATEGEIAALAKRWGGWVQKLDRPRVTLRLPAARFDEAIASIGSLGQVLDKKLQASDVTDTFLDLRLRLENAEKLRARIAALLEQARNVQDALAVEKELARVTEEIERFKGALALMQDQVAYSTITVELRRTLPAHVRQMRFPFPWVRSLGVDSLFTFER